MSAPLACRALPADRCDILCRGSPICDGGFGCPFVLDPAPPTEDDWERFVEARGRP